MLKIIDALLASLQPTFVNNGCILHENSYENLRQAFYMFPILEMSSAFLTGKNKVEFSYNVFQGKINIKTKEQIDSFINYLNSLR